MNSTQIEFTIQGLNGDTFKVNISRLEADKVWHCQNQYNNFALDVLKAAIGVHTGFDPISQQLFCEKELTILDSLIPLENHVITLMIKPSFRIEYRENGGYTRARELYTTVPTSDTIPMCYLHCPLCPKISFEVIGQYRDFFKIASNNLPQYLLKTTRWCSSRQYTITSRYCWLQYHKRSMNILYH